MLSHALVLVEHAYITSRNERKVKYFNTLHVEIQLLLQVPIFLKCLIFFCIRVSSILSQVSKTGRLKTDQSILVWSEESKARISLQFRSRSCVLKILRVWVSYYSHHTLVLHAYMCFYLELTTQVFQGHFRFHS